MSKTRDTGYLNNVIKTDTNGNVTFVNGSTTLMSISASGAVTTTGVISGSNALSASYAQTASYANAFTVANTLTAQTLVVQTITSSVSFITGSTKFGSLSSNTHQFTGSVDISGSLSGTSALFTGSLRTDTGLGLKYGSFVSTSGYLNLFAALGGSTMTLNIKDGTGGYESAIQFNNTANRSYAFPNADGTVALLSGTQTFTGATTFSSSVTANSLTVSSTTNAGLIAATNSTAGYSYLDFINNGTSGKNYQIGVGGNTAASGYANNLYFDLVGTGTIMTLTSGRNVGIGTTSTGFNTAGLPLVVGSGIGNTGMTIFSGNAYAGSIHFADAETTGAASYAGYINYIHSANSMQFGTNSNDRMTILSGGNVGIGTSSPQYKTQITDTSANNVTNVLALHNGSNAAGTGTGARLLFKLANFESSAETRKYASIEGISTSDYNEDIALVFKTKSNNADPTERMRITSAGIVQITNAGSLTNSVQIYSTANAATSGTTAIVQLNQSFGIGMDTISSVEYGTLGGNSAMGGILFRTYSGSYAYRYFFYSNGTAYNSSGTWGNSSDIKLKQNIVDANPQWDDIKALKFKKYKLKKDVQAELESTDGYVAPTHFGLIAQDVELTSPGLVEDVADEEGTTKMLKTSIMLMKSVKALQEAMQRIETLETENDTLKEILQRNNIQ